MRDPSGHAACVHCDSEGKYHPSDMAPLDCPYCGGSRVAPMPPEPDPANPPAEIVLPCGARMRWLSEMSYLLRDGGIENLWLLRCEDGLAWAFSCHNRTDIRPFPEAVAAANAECLRIRRALGEGS